MKRLLVALALIAFPSVASAAPQTITIQYFAEGYNNTWYLESSTPPITNFAGANMDGRGWLMAGNARVANALRSLSTGAATDKKYSCKATAFFSHTDEATLRAMISVTALNPKNCEALN